MSLLKRFLKNTLKLFKFKKKRKAVRTARRPSSRRTAVKKKKPAAKVSRKIIRRSPKIKKVKVKKQAAVKPSVKVKPAAVKKAVSKPRGLDKKAVAVKARPEKEIVIGEITHFFSKIQVVVVKVIKGPINAGDVVRIKGKNVDFTQKIASMQVESVDVKQAKKGQLIGLKVVKPAHPGDKLLAVK